MNIEQNVLEISGVEITKSILIDLSVETAILTLENLGFDTLPFGVILDESLDIHKDEE